MAERGRRGSASNITVNNGLQIVNGRVTSTTINAGEQVVNGNATNTIVNSGGSQWVTGSASGTTVNVGGTQTVASGGSATGTTVSSGGIQNVSSGGSAAATTIAGGEQNVYGIAANTSITGDGTQNIHAGGTATDTTIFACVQNVSGGATASVTTVNSGGTQNVLASGAAIDTTVNSGGLQYVYSGGTASGTTVSGGGLMNIAAGAVIGGTTTVNGGTVALIGNGSYTIPTLAATGGTVRLAHGTNTGRSLTISSLSGNANFVINTDLAAGQADTITVSGGNSQNTLTVAYDPVYATGQNATGSASEHGAYTYTPTLTATTAGATTTWAVTALTVGGESETVRTAGDVAAGSLFTWRTENNNLTKRMGELRNATGEAGMWLRTYRGAQDIAGVDGRAVKQQYTALQGGWDRRTTRRDGNIYTGYAVGYLEGSSTFSRGSGEASSFTAGGYASWLGKKGHYADVIAKVGKFRNNYTSYLNDAANTKVDGSYESWGTSLSAEYGYRRQLKGGWYLEPQAELTVSRLNGMSYTTSDGTGIHNDAVNSCVGRLGLAVGRSVGDIHYYGKVSLAREFSAKAGITAASGGLAPVDMRQDLKENWLEFALGLTGKLGRRTDGYLEVTRTTGDKAKTPWQVNAGVRWSF